MATTSKENILSGLSGFKNLLNPKREDYDSLAEYVDALNKSDFFWGGNGGIAGAYTSYSLITYKRNGKDCEGYKRTDGSAVFHTKTTTYYNDLGANITNNIQDIDGTLYYKEDETGTKVNFWTLAAIVLVVVLLIILIVKRKK